MTTDGDSGSEIKASLSKAGQAFASFKNIWKSEISLKTKLHFVKSDVLTGHTAVCVRVMEVHESHRRQTRCLRRILNIFWHNIISNSELHRTTSTKQHQFCGEKKTVALDRPCPQDGTICHPQSRHALDSTWEKEQEEDREKPGEKQIQVYGISWGELGTKAKDMEQWRALVMALCAQGHEED